MTSRPETPLFAAILGLHGCGCPDRPTAGLPVAPVDGVSVDEERAYYDVRGATVEALRASLDTHRPEADDGEPYDAVTDWTIAWNFTYEPDAEGGCRMTSVATEVDVRTTLPRWAEAGGRELREDWARYVAALGTHERGHRDIALRTANDIQTALVALEAADCSSLHEHANQTGDRRLEQGREAERAYDRTTDHGRTQGARFGD